MYFVSGFMPLIIKIIILIDAFSCHLLRISFRDLYLRVTSCQPLVYLVVGILLWL